MARIDELEKICEGGQWQNGRWLVPDSDDGEETRTYDYTQEKVELTKLRGY